MSEEFRFQLIISSYLMEHTQFFFHKNKINTFFLFEGRCLESRLDKQDIKISNLTIKYSISRFLFFFFD